MEIIAGRNPVLMCLRLQRRQAQELLVAHGAKDPRIREAIRLAKAQGVPYRFCTADELNSLVPGVRHQGLVARVSALPVLALEDLIAEPTSEFPLFIALDEVQDPHNLGAVIRTADAAGANALIVPKRHAASLTPAVARASAGSIESIPVVTVPNLVRALEQLKEAGIWIVGADLEAQIQHWELDAQRALCLVLGNEGEGLRRLVRSTCDELVRVPIVGQAESLNVSVATGVLLYEILRQRQPHPAHHVENR